MAVFTNDNRSAWQAIADSTACDRPSVGKQVQIIGGRKYKGRTGTVVYHGPNRYCDNRYCDDARLALMEIIGRYGYVVKVKTDNGLTFLCLRNILKC